jgi:hypothetical protein
LALRNAESPVFPRFSSAKTGVDASADFLHEFGLNEIADPWLVISTSRIPCDTTPLSG